MSAGLDRATGRVALSRRQLARLLARHAGTAEPDDRADTELGELGVVTPDGIHPALVPRLTAIRRGSARLSLRRWHDGDTRPPVDLVVGAGGVVMLPVANDADEVGELIWHPRPHALGRIVIGLIGSPTSDAPPPVEPGRHRWSDLVAAATDPSTGIDLVDLRVAQPVPDPLTSLLVLGWHRDGGIAALSRPTGAAGEPDPSADPDQVQATAMHPLELWTQLTMITAALVAAIDHRSDGDAVPAET